MKRNNQLHLKSRRGHHRNEEINWCPEKTSTIPDLSICPTRGRRVVATDRYQADGSLTVSTNLKKTAIVTCLGIYCNSRTDRRIILSFSFYQFVLKCSPGFWKSSRNLPPVLKARDVANGTKHMEDGEKVKALWKRWMNACIGKKSAGSSFLIGQICAARPFILLCTLLRGHTLLHRSTNHL